MTRKNIFNLLSPHKKEIFKNYKLKELGLFGSVVRGDNNIESDVDMLVEYIETPDLIKYIELENLIEKILNTNVDLIIKSSIRPELRKEILKEAVYL